MKVSDYMSECVITANLKDGLHQTWERMRERRIRHMPVLDEREVVVGIISDRDIRRPDAVDDGLNHVHGFVLDDSMKVSQAMTDHPTTITADLDLTEVVGIFVDRKYGAVPVVDGNGRAVGMLSAYDLLRAFRDQIAG